MIKSLGEDSLEADFVRLNEQFLVNENIPCSANKNHQNAEPRQLWRQISCSCYFNLFKFQQNTRRERGEDWAAEDSGETKDLEITSTHYQLATSTPHQHRPDWKIFHKHHHVCVNKLTMNEMYHFSEIKYFTNSWDPDKCQADTDDPMFAMNVNMKWIDVGEELLLPILSQQSSQRERMENNDSHPLPPCKIGIQALSRTSSNSLINIWGNV